MEPSRFSTPSRVRSPVLGGVTASSTWRFLFSLSPNKRLTGLNFIMGCLPCILVLVCKNHFT